MGAEKARTFAPVKGMPPSIELRHPNELKIDDSYQRSIETRPSQRLIEAIAVDWDWRLCMPLVVSRRRDGLYVIDGQHRLTAAKLRGDIPYLPCCVGEYETPAEEAQMFVAANRARRAINRLDDFHAAIVAGDRTAGEVDQVVKATGLRISRKTGLQSWGIGEIAFTASIKRMLKKYDTDVCINALTAISTAFPNDVLSNGASLFLALSQIVGEDIHNVDPKRLAGAVGSLTMDSWSKLVEKTRRGGDRVALMRSTILKAYGGKPRSQVRPVEHT